MGRHGARRLFGSDSLRQRLRRGSRSTIAATLALGLLGGGLVAGLSTIEPVSAADPGSGGGGTIGGGSGTAGNFGTFYAMQDGFNADSTPIQGYMVNSMNWFFNALGAPETSGVTVPNAYTDMQISCDVALTKAEGRRATGAPAGQSRVVGMYWASHQGQTWGTAAVNRNRFRDLYNTWVAEGRQGISAEVLASPNYTQLVENGFNEGFNSIPSASFATTICIALNQSEMQLTYDLGVATDMASNFSLAGATNGVQDLIHLTPSNGRTENVAVETRLNWGGVEGNGRTVAKSSIIPNSGTSASPGFTPADFGWSSWPAGNFWFDIVVPQQGQMAGPAGHNGQGDPRESWSAGMTAPRKIITSGPTRDQLGGSEVLASGMFYNAQITARTNGFASSMTITDTIATDQVWIGSQTADVNSAPYMLDPNGNVVASTIQISRPGGQVIVSGTVTGIPDAFQAREYTLVVPTYVRPTSADYTITDSSNVCYTAARNNCIAGNSAQTRKVTPAPNKVWVLDANGALVAADPAQTNQQGADNKTFAPGSPVGAVVNGSIPANLAEPMSSYSITDDWRGAATYVDFSDVTKARVFLDGADVTNQFTITISGNQTTATANAAFLASTKGRASAATVKLYIGGIFRSDYDTNGVLTALTNAGYERWNNQTVPTNTPPVYTVTPTPDKVWVLDEAGALTSTDKNWSNNVGADNSVFLPNDSVAAVVNGSIPADLASAMSSYSLTDDWTAAAPYVDFSDASRAKVFLDGIDVTNQFTVTVVGSVTTATARPAFLATTLDRAAVGTIKLVISGEFRNDYSTDGATVVLTNSGSETWNNQTVPTNSPPVYTWTPKPTKGVIGSSEESGDKTYADINGASVWPGQKLEYTVGVDLRIPAGTARGIKSLAVEDVYDPYFTPDKNSIEFWDTRGGQSQVIPKRFYRVVYDDAANKFTATFTQAWIDANVGVDGANSQWLNQGWLTMRLTGTVSPLIAPGSTVVNQAFQIINGGRTATEIPVVEIPTVTPDKESLTSDLADIDGKTLVEGDRVIYRLTLDGGPSRDKLAYNVHKLGMVDDFDEEYLALDAAGIKVTEKDTGLDVTSAFNVEVTDGVAYVFAKQVDTLDPYEQVIPGDPQPADLAAYDAAPIKPLEQPIIDQDLLGKSYWVTLDTTVSKVEDGYVVSNQARQNIQNVALPTRVVSNPLKAIDPTKDVVIGAGDADGTEETSIDGGEVRLYSLFDYRLNSSEIPANRAYAAKSWSMSDTFDRVRDAWTDTWAIHASTDLYDGADLVVAKGELIQNSEGTGPYTDLFTVDFDEATYTATVTATSTYLDLVATRPDLANAFSAYVKMERLAPSERIENVVDETYNGVERESNLVWTFTKEYPEVQVKKFTLSEGVTDGDRNELTAAYAMSPLEIALGAADPATPEVLALQNGVEVGMTFTNSGDAPLVNVSLVDVTHDGLHGDVQDIMCVAPEAQDSLLAGAVDSDAVVSAPLIAVGGSANDAEYTDADGVRWAPVSAHTTLALGQVVECKGTLRGMTPGMTHGDTVVVTAESGFSGVVVKDSDPWFARAASTPVVSLVKYTLDEGKEAGNRNTADQALVLTAEQARDGLSIAFEATNVGDEPLTGLAFTDVTAEGTTGTVENIRWIDGDTERPLAELTDLAVGQSVLLVGTLTGVVPGSTHTDTATVTGQGLYSTTPVTASDAWNGGLAPRVVVTGEVVGRETDIWFLGGAVAMLLAAAGLAHGVRRRRSMLQAIVTGR